MFNPAEGVFFSLESVLWTYANVKVVPFTAIAYPRTTMTVGQLIPFFLLFFFNSILDTILQVSYRIITCWFNWTSVLFVVTAESTAFKQ